ncbi:MAG: amidohydrolase [Acidimicrobiia bacterium]|nr:amidohydrolase [Acidimicrobiia bacterium]
MNHDLDTVRSVATRVAPRAIELRRAIHRRPELGRQEFATTQLVVRALAGAGIESQVRSVGTGLTAEVGTGGSLVGFRADLDALPIHEQTGLSFASELPGLMHACGHDAHTAIAVGIALALKELGPLAGRVRFIFQPAEELFPGGADELLGEGAIDGVQAIIAFHVDPILPPGQIGFKTGPITSSSDRFLITVDGPGGHTARPHDSIDTIFAAGQIITQLPAILDRLVDARLPLSLVFGRVQGGIAGNVIPASVELSGTCRSLDRETWERMPKLVERLVHEIVAPLGAVATVNYEVGIPPVINDQFVVAEVEYAVSSVLGTHAVALTHASLGAEDFSYFLQEIPGALFRLGAQLPDRKTDLHSAWFDIDEAAIETGIVAGTTAMLRLMACDW